MWAWDVEFGSGAGLGEDGRGMEHAGNPRHVGRDLYGGLRLGLGTRSWEMAPSCVRKLCEVLVGAVLVEDNNNISDYLFCARLWVKP